MATDVATPPSSGFTNNLSSITRTADAQAALAKQSEAMGKTEFLKLFTAQLRNQNPLDPVKNEAFVAQLAQFSQLEATTNMSDSLSGMVASMQGDRMMTGAALIGKKVAAAGLPAVLAYGQPVSSIIDLPNGADSVRLEFRDASGTTVRSIDLGAQKPGQTGFTWDGTDNAGNALPDGAYIAVATATLAGQKGPATVSTLSTVLSVNSSPASKDLTLELEGGASVLLSKVVRVGI